MKNPIARTNIQTFVISAAALIWVSSLMVVSSSLLFGGLPASIYGLVVSILFIGGYLGWKGLARKARLPKSGLELPLAVFIIGLVVSLVFSPNPHIGLERVNWMLFFIVVFYLALDIFASAEAREKTRMAFLWVSGFLILAALLETYAWYLSWWAGVGSRNFLPPFQYRFVSLAMHASPFMMIVNMCAPLAVVALFKARSRAVRFGSIFWLATYALAVPFSSTRAGWLGAAAWVFTLSVSWLSDPQNRTLLLNQLRRFSLKILIPCIILGGLGFTVAFLFIYQGFAAGHPTHGGGTSLNREMIWGSALTVAQESPWVGAGPGQAPHKLLTASQQSPFEFWPTHAHSTPLQVLAEYGIAGFLPYLFLLAWAIYRGIRVLHVAHASERAWIWGSIAAIASAAVHGVFDDITSSLFTLGLIVFHAASILYQKPSAERFSRISLAWLAVPSIMIACVTALNIWTAVPYHQAFELAKAGDWTSAARALERSIQRNPMQPGYWNQAGMAWASVWRETGDPQALAAARSSLERTLTLDSGNSLVWANLAVLDWHAGQREQALSHIRQAIALSPKEPSYWLNYGAFLEQLSQPDEAEALYKRVIVRNPEVVSHPFWRSSPVRERALGEVIENLSENRTSPYWMLARTALETNDFPAARWNLSLSDLYNEMQPASMAVRAELVKREEKEAGDFHKRLEAVLESVETQYWQNNEYPSQYGLRWFPFGVVPGYLKISEDGGQFAALTELVHLQIEAGDCQAAGRTWLVLQRELRAGELAPPGNSPAPVCP